MKKVLLVSVSLVAMGTASAFAADLPARAPAYTKAPVMAAVYNWAGFYVGGNGGGASSHKCWTLNSVNGAAIPATDEGCHDATGGLVGGQIGYRWQMTNWVFGLEAQGDWANLKGSNTSSLAALSPLVNETKIDAIGLFTGQIGYAWNNVLWYGKGGAAVTHDKYSTTSPGFTFGNVFIPAGQFDQASETRWGGVIGTGIEFGFAPGWSIAFEYDHLFMGNRDVSFAATAVANSRTDNIKQNVDMGTVRFNYTFGGPVVAKY